MKDYAKILNSNPQQPAPKQPIKQTLARTAIQKNKEASHEKSGRGFFYLLIILLIAVLAGSAIRQHLHHPGAAVTKKEKKEMLLASTVSGDENAIGPQFDFYTTLPNGKNPGFSGSSSELPAPAGPSASPVEEAPLKSESSTPVDSSLANSAVPAPAVHSENSKYYLQAGTFSNSADAQQMLSELLLLGMNVSIQDTQDNNQPAYEVMVGPFEDEAAINVVKQQLDAHQILSKVVEK